MLLELRHELPRHTAGPDAPKHLTIQLQSDREGAAQRRISCVLCVPQGMFEAEQALADFYRPGLLIAQVGG